MNSIKKINHDLKFTELKNLPDKLKTLASDERVAVKKLVNSYEKKYVAYLKESERLKTLNTYENECIKEGYTLIAGMDEVGRGPLAGPVVASIVILKPDTLIYGINDSKKLSENKRGELFWQIKNNSIDIGIGIVDVSTIDKINIKNATFKAMSLAIESIKIKPDIVLVDGYYVPDLSIKQKAIIKGDSLSTSIAAASIIAKVTRDEMMYHYHDAFPQYDFDKNKGYGTKKHIEAIGQYGLTPLHRMSFVKNFV